MKRNRVAAQVVASRLPRSREILPPGVHLAQGRHLTQLPAPFPGATSWTTSPGRLPHRQSVTHAGVDTQDSSPRGSQICPGDAEVTRPTSQAVEIGPLTAQTIKSLVRRQGADSMQRDSAGKTPKIRYLSRREMLGLMGSSAVAIVFVGCGGGGEQPGQSSFGETTSERPATLSTG